LQVAVAVVAAYDSGELQAAVREGGQAWKKWINALGKAQKRKGKRLFMPVRLALTGSTHVSSVCFASNYCYPLQLHFSLWMNWS
jgi:glutamyl/glutaminyl-tRNA synthetase